MVDIGNFYLSIHRCVKRKSAVTPSYHIFSSVQSLSAVYHSSQHDLSNYMYIMANISVIFIICNVKGFPCLISRSGVPQALWLTKTKLIPSLPPHLLLLAQNPANQIPDQDERVQNAIKHARFWDTTEERPCKEKYR